MKNLMKKALTSKKMRNMAMLSVFAIEVGKGVRPLGIPWS